MHTHILIRNEAKYPLPDYWHIDSRASLVLTDMIGPPDRQEVWWQINREPGLSVAQEQVRYVLNQALGDQAHTWSVAGQGRHRDAARPLYGTLIGKGRTDELTEDRFILLQSEGQRISYYRVDSSPLPGPGDHVYVNPALIEREKLTSHILDRVMHSLDGKTYTALPSRHEHDIYCRNLDPAMSEKLWGLVEAQGRLLSELSERSHWRGHILKQDHHVYQFSPQGLDNLEFGRNLSRPDDLHILAVHQQHQAPGRERQQEQYLRHHLGYDLSL